MHSELPLPWCEHYTGPILLADVLLGALLLFTFAFVVTVIAHIFLGVPYVPTPWRVAEAMVQLADMRGSETIYDLGAGDGRLLIAAKRKHPNVRAIGCEVVPTIWLLGKLRILLSRQNIDFRMTNAFKEDLRDANVLFLYLMPELLAKLEPKFDEELQPGTRVISCTFRFPGKEPVQEVLVPWGRKGKKILLYQW